MEFALMILGLTTWHTRNILSMWCTMWRCVQCTLYSWRICSCHVLWMKNKNNKTCSLSFWTQNIHKHHPDSRQIHNYPSLKRHNWSCYHPVCNINPITQRFTFMVYIIFMKIKNLFFFSLCLATHSFPPQTTLYSGERKLHFLPIFPKSPHTFTSTITPFLYIAPSFLDSSFTYLRFVCLSPHSTYIRIIKGRALLFLSSEFRAEWNSNSIMSVYRVNKVWNIPDWYDQQF